MADDKKVKIRPKGKIKPAKKPEKKVRFVMKQRDQKREFPFSDDDFLTLSDMIHQKTGIVLKNHKKDMVYGRLSRRLRKLGIQSFSDYLLFLSSEKGEAEVGSLINAITTNLTRFFREPHHFVHLSEKALPEILENIKTGRQDRLRIWSAGCSSGEEPYSIAMALEEALVAHDMLGIDARILATDLDTNMLQRGRNGDYLKNHFDNLPEKYKIFIKQAEDREDCYHVLDDLRRYIAFKQLNLLSEWPMKGLFDVIFCRNVMIYFDNDDKIQLTQRLINQLRPGGFLMIGHSETILNNIDGLELIGRTIYRKKQ